MHLLPKKNPQKKKIHQQSFEAWITDKKMSENLQATEKLFYFGINGIITSQDDSFLRRLEVRQQYDNISDQFICLLESYSFL